MKRIIPAFLLLGVFGACTNPQKAETTVANVQFGKLCAQYYEDFLKLNPLTATYAGDNRYNDLLPNDGAVAYLNTVRKFDQQYLDSLKNYQPESLDENDRLSYEVLKDQLETNIEGMKYHLEYLPFNQMVGLPLTMGQLGSGSGAQPFKTVKDYDNWLKRVSAFSIWADTAIGNFKKGIATGIVFPKALVVKMYPQMLGMVVSDPTKSLFYTPITNMPKEFSEADKKRITQAYLTAIQNELIPAYQKMGQFLQQEYLPKSRTTSGISSVPGGKEIYAYVVKQQTTTTKSAEEIYQTGLKEVARIHQQMDSIKNVTGFKGDLNAFFTYMKTDAKFRPYKTPAQVLAAFEQIHQRMEPNLKKMFNEAPKTPFEIRQTEAFRAASASAEYNQGSADGKRPGIFYVPILDATKFNTTSGMESLFLHEAIPGHHYQISLTQENTALPNFRRFGFHNAYVEGWALYCESLGKELGLYTDPYQHMGALGDEMHRAIRLVVDVAIHTKNMTREEAIKYMMANEPADEQNVTAEIERYMSWPGQALGYKIGAMKIRELRNKYEKKLGDKFKLTAFHHQLLKDGSLPLSVLEAKMDTWAATAK